MSILRFSDGESFDTSGELRAEKRRDGWYVVGKGRLVPVDSHEEAMDYIKSKRPGNHEEESE